MTKKQYRISKEIKDQILKRIKEEGVSVSQAAEEHGISSHTIYSWLSREAQGLPTFREFNKLRKENQELKALVGELTVELSKIKKNR